MVAILGGLGAALSWAIATLASSRTSRMIGAMSVVGWVMVVGLVVAIVPAILARPVPLGIPELAGLVVLGLCHNIGLLLVYRALTVGRVSIVAPIAATEGAIAALLSVALGESLAFTTGVLLVAIAVGVVLAAAERTADAEPALHEGSRRTHDPAANRKAAVLALAAAATFSVGLVLSGRFGASGMSPAWVIVATRTVGIIIIVLPLVLTRRFRLSRPALPLVLLAGVLEAAGSAVYVIAASQGVAVAAVLSSQFAAIAAIGGFFLFGERIQRHQLVGVGVIALGVTILAAVQA
jgi:drug/metabolite transporter (DMT)-like permease